MKIKNLVFILPLIMTSQFQAIQILLPTLNNDELVLILIHLVQKRQNSIGTNDISIDHTLDTSSSYEAVLALLDDITVAEHIKLSKRILKTINRAMTSTLVPQSLLDQRVDQPLDNLIDDEDRFFQWCSDKGDSAAWPVVTKEQLDKELDEIMSQWKPAKPCSLPKGWTKETVSKLLQRVSAVDLPNMFFDIDSPRIVKGNGCNGFYFHEGYGICSKNENKLWQIVAWIDMNYDE